MASNYRRSSKHKELNNKRKIMWFNSSDTDFDVPQLKKVKPNQQKNSLKTIHSACQENISLQTCSSESSNCDTEENNETKHAIVTDKRNTKKIADDNGYQRRRVYRLNKSDNASAEDSVRKRRKHMAIKKNMQSDLDDKYYRNSNEVLLNGHVRKCEATERGKQAIPQNFKPVIKKMIENLKSTFSKFTFQMHRLQLKYLEPDIVTLQDVADIIFIFSSIMCKLKEELNEKEQDLTNSYINCIMMCNSNDIVSNVNDKQRNRILQEQVDTSPECSISSQVISPNICQKQSVKTTKSSSRCVSEIDKGELPLQGTNNSINNYQTKDNFIIQNNESIASHLDSLKMSKLIEIPVKEFVVPPKIAEDSTSNREMSNKNSINTSKKLAGTVNRHVANESIIEVESLSDNDSNLPREKYGALSNNRVSISEQETDFIYPDTNKLNGKNRFTTSRKKCEDTSFKGQNDNEDTRLDMNCQVLVEKFTLNKN